MAMKKIAEGAESDIYLTDFMGVEAVVKYRREKPYLIPELDRQLRESRTRMEARAMHKAASAVDVPRLLLLGKYFIVMEKVDGIAASELGGLDAKAAALAGASLAGLHNNGIIHGDFTTANIMVGKAGVCIIDFGLSYFSEADEDRAFDMLLIKRSISSKAYASFARAYSANCAFSRNVFSRLRNIEMRGRYQNRSLETA